MSGEPGRHALCQGSLDADALARLIAHVAFDLLGSPNKALSSKRELRFGNNGSLAVTVAGEKRGQWYSFEEGRGGGTLDLIVYLRGGVRAQAMQWLKSQPYAATNPRRSDLRPLTARSSPT